MRWGPQGDAPLLNGGEYGLVGTLEEEEEHARVPSRNGTARELSAREGPAPPLPASPTKSAARPEANLAACSIAQENTFESSRPPGFSIVNL